MTSDPCPSPHDADGGYCPECGLLMPVAAVGRPATTCPDCGTVDEHGARYCEGCGCQLTSPAPSTGLSEGTGERPGVLRWSAIVSTDRRLFEAMRGAEQGFVLPERPPWRVALDRSVIRIGRSEGPGPTPELDLETPPADPGVSREHAELTRKGDVGWDLRDSGSRNGTWVGRSRLRPDEVARLTGGERIRLGLWSRIELVVDQDDG